MAIQGTQVPMYTNTHCFLYFYDFSIFYIKNKINKTENKLNKTKHKTRLTQNLKAKHTSNANTKIKREKEK